MADSVRLAYWRHTAHRQGAILCDMLETLVLAGILRHGRGALRFAYERGCAFFDHGRQALYDALIHVARVVGVWRDGDQWCVHELLCAVDLASESHLDMLETFDRAWPPESFGDLCSRLREAQHCASWS